jgi:hypothetical protein
MHPFVGTATLLSEKLLDNVAPRTLSEGSIASSTSSAE